MFQPAIPFDGLVGWRFLQRTYDTQIAAFVESPQLKRDTDYFRENISNIQSAEDLVSDRRLLTVALGAFGLQDDIDNKFFIQKMLQEGTTNDDAFANKFADPRYSEFSAAFGLGPGEIPLYRLAGFADNIIDSYERQSFEIAVGEQNESMRIALTAEREFSNIAAEDSSETAKWFEIMGNPPMRELFETVFQLPTSFSQIDIDQQQQFLSDRSLSIFGTSNPADYDAPELQEQLLTRYTALSQINSINTATQPAAIALTLLRGF